MATVATPAPPQRIRRRRKPNGVNALWRFAQEHPEAALQLAVQYEPAPVAPLQFEPIAIEELETDQR
jgi:hypothetical protein